MHIDEVHLYSSTMTAYHVAITKEQLSIFEIKISHTTKTKTKIKQWKLKQKWEKSVANICCLIFVKGV